VENKTSELQRITLIQTHGEQAKDEKMIQMLKKSGILRRDLDEELFGREYDDAFHDFD
jgi:hypothetical protein